MQIAVALILCIIGTAAAMAAEPGTAAALRASYAAHRADIEKNKFGKPLYLESKQTSNTLQGDIYALIDQPFDKVQAALADPRNWCDILILHPNVKGCRLNEGGEPSMTVSLGRSELPVQFSCQPASKTADYLDMRLGSPTGPFGTTDYGSDSKPLPWTRSARSFTSAIRMATACEQSLRCRLISTRSVAARWGSRWSTGTRTTSRSSERSARRTGA